MRAWSLARQRADALPAARLLYDARLGRGRLAAVPGTLAVTYDGSRIRRASLTGPFGSPIAEYRDGTLIGEDRQAFLVEPDALRSILAGVWTGGEPRVEGRDRGDLLLSWSGAVRVEGKFELVAEGNNVAGGLRGSGNRDVEPGLDTRRQSGTLVGARFDSGAAIHEERKR